MAQFKTAGDLIDYTPSADTLGGAVAVLGGDMIVVAISDIAADETGAAYIRGSFEFDTEETMTQGDLAFWDASASKITATDTDVYAGRVVEDSASSKVVVSINFKHEVAGS